MCVCIFFFFFFTCWSILFLEQIEKSGCFIFTYFDVIDKLVKMYQIAICNSRRSRSSHNFFFFFFFFFLLSSSV